MRQKLFVHRPLFPSNGMAWSFFSFGPPHFSSVIHSTRKRTNNARALLWQLPTTQMNLQRKARKKRHWQENMATRRIQIKLLVRFFRKLESGRWEGGYRALWLE